MLKTKIVKQPSVIKIIKVNKCNKFWDTEYFNTKYYYSFFNNKAHIYSFLNEESANNCLEFLEKYKKINLRYPNQDTPSNFIQKELVIDDESLISMQERCSLSGIGLLGITNFTYKFHLNYTDIDYRAIDLLENINTDNNKIVNYLKYIYDTI